MLEAGEDPLVAAKREVLEECGYASADADWHYLGAGVPDANRGCGLGHMYLATNARFVGKADSGQYLLVCRAA